MTTKQNRRQTKQKVVLHGEEEWSHGSSSENNNNQDGDIPMSPQAWTLFSKNWETSGTIQRHNFRKSKKKWRRQILDLTKQNGGGKDPEHEGHHVRIAEATSSARGQIYRTTELFQMHKYPFIQSTWINGAYFTVYDCVCRTVSPGQIQSPGHNSTADPGSSSLIGTSADGRRTAKVHCD